MSTKVQYSRSRAHGGPVFGHASGLSLFEVLMFSVLFVMLGAVAYSVFYNSVRLSAMHTSALDRIRAVETVREEFSQTVRESAGIAAGVGVHRTGADAVVLRIPPSPENGAAPRYVVFGRILGKPPLVRMEVAEENGQYTTTSFSRYPLPAKAVHLDFDTADPLKARRVALEIEVPNAVKGKSKPSATYRFVAALRNGGIGTP